MGPGRADRWMLLAALGLVSGSCRDKIPKAATPADVVSFNGSLAELANRYGGAAWTIPEEISLVQNSRADEAACGPFPCTASGCLVVPCSDYDGCSTGFCHEASWPHGYCVTDDPH